MKSGQLISLLLTAISLFFSYFSYAHDDIIRPVVSRLSTSEGLSQGEVSQLLIDKNGFLWVGTQDGLNRYDGYTIQRISGPDNAFRHANIIKLFQDSRGYIWISTFETGLYRLAPSDMSVSHVIPIDNLSGLAQSRFVHDVIEDDRGNMWFAFDKELLKASYRTPQLIQKVHELSSINDEQPFIRQVTIHENFALLATSIGLYVVDINTGQEKQIRYSSKDNYLTQNTKQLLKGKNNILWIGTVDGLFSLQLNDIAPYMAGTASIRTKNWDFSRNIWKIIENDNELMLATDAGLYHLDMSDKHFTHLFCLHQTVFRVSDINIVDMVQDKTGGYWLASAAEGAYFWNPYTTLFKNYQALSNHVDDSSNKLSNQIVWTVEQESDSLLWIGTDNGLNLFDINTGKATRYLYEENLKARDKHVSVFEITRGDGPWLWLTTLQGLMRFNTETFRVEPIPIKNQSIHVDFSNVWQTIRHPSGDIWFINERGFYSWSPETQTLTFHEKLTESFHIDISTSLLGFFPKSNDEIMVGQTGELWRYNIHTGAKTLLYKLPIADYRNLSSPDSWVVDKFGTLWVSFLFEGIVGLDLLNDEVIAHLNSKNRLPNNSVWQLLNGPEGDVWMSSHAGILRMNPANFHVEVFTTEDGLDTNEFNQGAGTVLKDGQIIFGSVRGFTLFDPNAIKERQSVPQQVTITNIDLLSREVQRSYSSLNDQRIQLSHDDFGLRINFSTLNYGGHHKIKYLYQLQGDETINYPESETNNILIPKLSPGQYQFSVSALDLRSGLLSEPAMLSISVAHAAWLSPLAMSSYALFVFASCMLIILRRMHQRKQMIKAHEEIKSSEERLKLALRSSESGVWDYDVPQDQLYEPRIHQDLKRSEIKIPIHFNQHMELIHPHDRAEFTNKWEAFINSDIPTFECNYRLENHDGHWLWYRDLGKVVKRDDSGFPERITGTYTNITEKELNKEQAQLFGEAFQKTRDGVLILDHQFHPIAANKSFYQLFHTTEERLFTNPWHAITVSDTTLEDFRRLLIKLDINEHWQGEKTISTPDNPEIPVLVNINSFSESTKSHRYYVVVVTDITKQKEAEATLRRMASYDPLTSLPNRTLLMDRVNHAIDRAKRYKLSICLFFLDLDRFKQVNDSLGHEAGDTLLKEVANRLTQCLRADDTVARLGGDEFVILLEQFSSTDDLSNIAKKIINAIDTPITIDGQQMSVSTSIGISVYPYDASTATDLLKNADLAMYHAKEQGRNNFQFFTHSMNEKAKLKLLREYQLKQAQALDQFVNYYQPIVDAVSGKIVGLELLLRWFDDGKMISPAEFIPLAEEIGLIVSMTENAMKRGLSDLSGWLETDDSLFISINLSLRHIEDERLIPCIIETLKETNTRVENLHFEITESMLMKDKEKALTVMNKIKDMGISLALDDFGTGYSSLQYIKSFPIDIIKIDRSFVNDIGVDKNDEAIIDAILAIADTLNLQCIAEGVETREQQQYLVNQGCKLIQGYLYSRPVQGAEVPRLLMQRDLLHPTGQHTDNAAHNINGQISR